MQLRTDGTLWVRGLNTHGQIGDGTTANRGAPRQVMTNVAQISAGDHIVSALRNDGTVWTWGFTALSPVRVSSNVRVPSRTNPTVRAPAAIAEKTVTANDVSLYDYVNGEFQVLRAVARNERLTILPGGNDYWDRMEFRGHRGFVQKLHSAPSSAANNWLRANTDWGRGISDRRQQLYQASRRDAADRRFRRPRPRHEYDHAGYLAGLCGTVNTTRQKVR